MRPNPFTTNRERVSQNTAMISNQPVKTVSKPKPSFTTAGGLQNIQATNFRQQKYLWTLSQIVDQSDATVGLDFNISTFPNEKRRFLEIQSIKTFLLDYAGSDFPACIYITSNQLDGYLNQGWLSTHIIGTSYAAVGSSVVKGGFTLNNIGYTSQLGSQTWDISGVTNLKIRVCLQPNFQNPISFPIQNPIQIKAKIIRVII